MMMNNEEYSKIKEICLTEYLRHPYARFISNANGWSLSSRCVNTRSPQDYFNENFLPLWYFIGGNLFDGIILMKDIDTVSVMSSIHTTKCLPKKVLSVGRIIIVYDNAEISVMEKKQ